MRMSPTSWGTKLFRPPAVAFSTLSDVSAITLAVVRRSQPTGALASEAMPPAIVNYTILLTSMDARTLGGARHLAAVSLVP